MLDGAVTEKDASMWKHQKARGQLVKQMGKRIPEKDRKKKRTVWKKHKRESVQHEMIRTQINLLWSMSKQVEKTKNTSATQWWKWFNQCSLKENLVGEMVRVTIILVILLYRLTVKWTLFTLQFSTFTTMWLCALRKTLNIAFRCHFDAKHPPLPDKTATTATWANPRVISCFDFALSLVLWGQLLSDFLTTKIKLMDDKKKYFLQEKFIAQVRAIWL